MEMQIDDGRLPKDFPLGTANNGQFVKKFKGKRWQFGAISLGWKAALARYAHDWPFILQGKLPPPMHVEGQPAPSSAIYVATEFIKREDKRVQRGKLDGGSFTDIRNAIEVAVKHVGPGRDLLLMLPDDWADLRHALSFNWKKVGEGDAQRWEKQESRVGPACLKRRVVHVRAMMRWAGPTGSKLLPVAPSYSDEFPLVSGADVLKAKRAGERINGVKRFEVGEVMPIFNALDEQLQAMFLLSLNCGYTAADCAALPRWAVDLDKGTIDYDRKKTGNVRKAFLWPETIEAMRHVVTLNLKAASGREVELVHQPRGDDGTPIGKPTLLGDCFFVTSKGGPWVYRKVKNDDAGLGVTETHKDSVALEFNKVLVALGIKRPKVGFGAGRSTFETHALRVADKSLVNAVMGHSTGEMSEWYDSALDEDLLALFAGVRARLLPNAKKWPEPAASGAPNMRLVG
jgi:integrase